MKTGNPTAGAMGIAGILLLASACGTLRGSEAASPPMQRELEFGSPSEVVDAGGSFRASLSVPFGQETDDEGTHEIEIPIEGSVPIYCFVWADEAELSVTVIRTARLIFEELQSASVTVSGQRIVALDAGAIGDAAYQSLKAVFQLRSEEGEGTGLMKVAAANKDGHGLACNHWDVGYVESFDRVFRELVRSFRAPEPAPEPYYKEIVGIRVGELSVGVATTTFTRDAEGDVQGISETSFAIPTSASELAVSYSKTTDWSDEQGHLINAYAVESDADSEHTRLALDWDGERGWHVAGVFQEKQIEADLDHAGHIHSMLTDMLAMKYLLAPRGERSRITLTRWVPDADPTRVIETPFVVDADDARQLTMHLGGVELEASRDAQGLLESGRMQVGGVTMTLERIYQHGEI